MRHTIVHAVVLAALAGFIMVGCDARPPVPKTPDGKKLTTLTVSAGDEAELAGATAMEACRIEYKFRLEVLQSYYEHIGDATKYLWAQEELENLAEAQKFTWVGLPQIVPPEREPIEGADERVLVEDLVLSRRRFIASMDELAQLYERKNIAWKASVIRNVQARLLPHRTYMYFISAEVPGPELRPSEVVSAAEQLYAEAMKLYKSGKPLPGVTSYPKQRKALELLVQIVHEYPTSTKIALSAYFIGEIYKEYFQEDLRSVQWYERAWQWDPDVPQPARFQAATVYDIRLHDIDKAIECYKLAIQYDPDRFRNKDYARQRIRELTKVSRQPRPKQ